MASKSAYTPDAKLISSANRMRADVLRDAMRSMVARLRHAGGRHQSA